jgi:starch synthase
MPRFGIINERRHRLHEVVRFSGINVSVDNDDHPLQIKVASCQMPVCRFIFWIMRTFLKESSFFMMRRRNGMMIMG